MNSKHILTILLCLGVTIANARQADKKNSMEPIEQKITFSSEGEQITGKLLLPPTYKNGQKLPVIIVVGPWTQVKEQIQYFYGTRLAQRGYAVLNFDFRFWGESGGQPRSYESTSEKVKDVLNAISYVKTHKSLDAEDISMIGVCAGAGIVVRASTLSPDVKRIATAAAWLQHPSSTPVFYGGDSGVQERITLAENARKKYNESAAVDYVEAYNPNNPRAAMFFPLDYYGNPKRGAVPQWKNKFAVMSWKEWLNLNVIDGVAENINCPVVMVHSDDSALPENVRKFYAAVRHNNKQLVWLEGEHTQFYDDDAHVDAAIGEILKFFAASKKDN